MQVGVIGAEGAVGAHAMTVLASLGVDAVALPRDAPDPTTVDVVVLASPPGTWRGTGATPAIGAAVRPGAPVTTTSPLVASAGWWGGLGTLLAAVTVDAATAPEAVHVAYGLPGTRRALTRASRTLRDEVLGLLGDPGTARVEGAVVPEPLAEGRRLAWFPRPVGPAHAAAVGGFEAAAPVLAAVPTVRTWLAAGSMTSELLQALGRSAPDGWLARTAVGRWAARAATATTATVRWAVVVEVRDEDGQVLRAWANGTDPVAATGALLAVGARRLALRGEAPTGTVLDLGEPSALLDELADLGVLRWSLSRPEQPRG